MFEDQAASSEYT